MKLFLLQLLFIFCICEKIEDTIMKLDSKIYEAISVPNILLKDSLLENIWDLYMSIDNMLEDVLKGVEESRNVVKSIINQGGLRLVNVEHNDTLLSQTYNLSVQSAKDIREAIGGVCYMWRRVKAQVEPPVTTTTLRSE